MELQQKPVQLKNLGTLTLFFAVPLFFAFTLYLIYIEDDVYRIVMGCLSIIGILIPRLLYTFTFWRKHITENALGLIEVFLVIVLAQNGAGAMGLYLQWQYYDLVLHVTGPLMCGYITAVLLESHMHPRVGDHLARVRWAAIGITIFCIFAWEVYEWFGDLVFNTHMFGQEGEEYDTLYDILAGIAAMFPLYWLIGRFHKKGSISIR